MEILNHNSVIEIIGWVLFSLGIGVVTVSSWMYYSVNRKLKAANAMLKNFFDLITVTDVAVWIKDANEFRYVYLNDKLCRFIYPNLSVKDVLGRNDMELSLGLSTKFDTSKIKIIDTGTNIYIQSEEPIPPCYYTDIIVSESKALKRFIEIMPSTGILLDVWKIKAVNRIYGVAFKKTSSLEESKKLFKELENLCFVKKVTDGILEIPRENGQVGRMIDSILSKRVTCM